MSRVVYLLGNGLSVGVSSEFGVAALTSRLSGALDQETREALAEIAVLGHPDLSERTEHHTELGFEDYAGPIDRIAAAVRALAPLAGPGSASQTLWDAYEYLRQRYVQLVGIVLSEVSRATRLSETARWTALNEFVIELRSVHRDYESAVFTLSYDTLLDSAMLESHMGWFYDGFAGPEMTLNYPLDCHPGTLPVYHLHGSVLWYETLDGTIRKLRSDSPKHAELLEQWSKGEASTGLPVVVLTDLKSRAVGENPFDLFYAELWNELAGATDLGVGGYAFRDAPVNTVVRAWMLQGTRPGSPSRKLHVWSPNLGQREVATSLAIADDIETAISVFDVHLPDKAALLALKEELSHPRPVVLDPSRPRTRC